jgi:RimJ/RimL family protein N-acetyltransferase
MTRPAMPDVAGTIAMMTEWMGDGSDINWVISDTPDGPALGRVAIYPHGKNNVWEAACMIAPAARGKNLAARALARALDEAFDARRPPHHGRHRPRQRRLHPHLRKLGFTLKAACAANGKYTSASATA